MRKIKKEDIIIFLIMVVITCIVFAPLIEGHYATDTYNIYDKGYYTYATKNSLNDGRIFMGILGLIVSALKIPIEVYSTLTLLGAIIISNLAVIVLKNIIEKYKPAKNTLAKIIISIISYITIFNFMYLDNMYFVENIIMAISVLLFIKSADILVEKNNKYLLKSGVLTILGVLAYQGTIGLFFTYVVLFSILKNDKNIKQIIVDILQSGIIGIISICVDLIAVKIIGQIIGTKQTRYGKLSNIFTNIIFIFSQLINTLIDTCDIFPKGVFIIYTILLGTIILIYSIKNKKENALIYEFLAIAIITIASAYIINLTTLTSFNTGRLKNPIGALIGIIFIFIYVKTDIFERKTIFLNIALITLITFTLVNTVNYLSIILQHKKVNQLEKEESSEIETYIENYEKETNIKINKIAKIRVRNSFQKGYFEEIKNKSDYCKNAIRTDWGIIGALEILENRKLEEIKPTNKEIENYFKNYDSEIGYECIGDTLFINIYNY